MWSKRLDLSRDECRRCLRCLELDGYGRIVSVLRAQGSLTDEKKKLLAELAKMLHISNERHRAEVRRAVNDEKLTLIAEQLNGPNTFIDWAIEGRRTIPLLPRLKAHTAFTGLANSLSLVLAAANENKIPKTDKPKIPSRDLIEDPSLKKDEKLKKTQVNHQNLNQNQIQNQICDSEANLKKRKRSSPGLMDEKRSKIEEVDLLKTDEIQKEEAKDPKKEEDVDRSGNSEDFNEKSEIRTTPEGLGNVNVSKNIKQELLDPPEDRKEIRTHLKVDKNEEIERKTPTLEDKVNNLQINHVDNPLDGFANVSSGPGPLSVNLNHSLGKMGLSVEELTKRKGMENKLANQSVIIVQKGATNSVKLSHGGKEVLGKVIIDSKNLCLSKSPINLLSNHSIKNNIEHKLKLSKTLNTSNYSESVDERPNNVEFTNNHHKLNHVEVKTANHSPQLLNRNLSPQNHNNIKENNVEIVTSTAKSKDLSIELECQEVLIPDQHVSPHILDPQTQIYKFEATDDHICEIQIDDTVDSEVDLLLSQND